MHSDKDIRLHACIYLMDLPLKKRDIILTFERVSLLFLSIKLSRLAVHNLLSTAQELLQASTLGSLLNILNNILNKSSSFHSPLKSLHKSLSTINISFAIVI